ncbi:MAG: SDR family oxidoreductase [Bdellovibrionaceae bacterium]|nr:SDR family oxidoreductase [Pseudobdellovibrionaceae bacterium]
MAMRALVAGGAGFVGSHLCELLLNKGYEVVVLDNFVTGREANLETLRKLGHRLEVVRHDITSPLPQSLKTGTRFDEIYNLASPASPVDFDVMPVFIMRTASEGHLHLLELAREHGARILFASSSEVYGDAEQHPQKETYFGNVNPIGHRGCYDEAKRFGEALSQSYWRQYKTPIRIARIFNTYGPRMRANDGRIIPNFFTQALKGQSLTVYGDGTQTRSFCFVTDLARGLYALMQSEDTRPVNVGNPIERSVLEMADAINRLTGNRAAVKYLPLPENDPKLRRPDTTRATSSLGWTPAVSLEKGLELSLDYFKSELAQDPTLEASVIQ